MLSYLIKILFTVGISFFILIQYFSEPKIFSPEVFGFSYWWFLILGILYGAYKGLQIVLKKHNSSTNIYLWQMVLGFFAILIITVLLFAEANPTMKEHSGGFFFNIIGYSLLPVCIFTITTALGKKLLSFVPQLSLSQNMSFLLSLGSGFAVFLTSLVIFGIFGLYNLYIVFGLLVIAIGVSWKELWQLAAGFVRYHIVVDTKGLGELKLVLAEILYIIAFFILSVALISIFRPAPIGWDDLGVYMNYPHLMAQDGSLLSLGAMYAWQVFTGIGYLFESPTQAFYLNVSGLFLSFIVLNIVFSDLLSSKNEEKTILPIPIILSTVFISLPMVVFQSMKDMKVDEGLFFLSVIAIYGVYKYYLLSKKEEQHKNHSIWILGIIGIIVGLCFSIKFTSLLLIVALLGVMSFVRVGIIGFVGYICTFLGVFTLGNFWKMMNVVINPENIAGLEATAGLVLLLLGGGLLTFGAVRSRENFALFRKEIGVFLIGIILVLVPWFGKNIYEAKTIGVSALLSGKTSGFAFELEKIHSKEEIQAIQESYQKERKKENAVTTNEDLLRYFGYEKGALNYLKMPYNLTFQQNQGGEFTNISFLFFLLIPLLFIFLPYRKEFYSVFVVFLVLLQLFLVLGPKDSTIPVSKVTHYNQEQQSLLFTHNRDIISQKVFADSSFIIKKVFKSVFTEIDYRNYSGKSKEQFYNELLQAFARKQAPSYLTENDTKTFNEYLHDFFDFYVFTVSEKESLKDLLTKNNFSLIQQQEILDLWDNYRSYNGKLLDVFATIHIPYAYLLVLLMFITPTVLLIYSVGKTRHTEVFQKNLVFACVYSFLWLISSFGIVWYGISMYFAFLLMIGVCLFFVSNYDDQTEQKEMGIKLLGSCIVLMIFCIYFIGSVFPHFSNILKNEGYFAYKSSQISSIESVFSTPSRGEILPVLNIESTKHQQFILEYSPKEFKDLIAANKIDTIPKLVGFLSFLEQDSKTSVIQKKIAKTAKQELLSDIVNVPKKYRNPEGVYRVGTFLKYYISQNNLRLLEDSLIFNFNDYIYDENSDITIERFKKLGLKYLLVDLNAATIDKSNTHDLTDRYEKLLQTFTNPKLHLVETDSICLKTALDVYARNKKMDEFISIAGTNYDSYVAEKKVGRSQKRQMCTSVIRQLINQKQVTSTQFSYLQPLLQASDQQIYNYISKSYQVLFEIQ